MGTQKNHLKETVLLRTQNKKTNGYENNYNFVLKNLLICTYVKESIMLCIHFLVFLITEDPKISAFHAAVLDDYETSVEDWNELVMLLQDQDYEETAMNLLASVTVLMAMQNALRTSLEFEHEEQGPDGANENTGDQKDK